MMLPKSKNDVENAAKTRFALRAPNRPLPRLLVAALILAAVVIAGVL